MKTSKFFLVPIIIICRKHNIVAVKIVGNIFRPLMTITIIVALETFIMFVVESDERQGVGSK